MDPHIACVYYRPRSRISIRKAVMEADLYMDPLIASVSYGILSGPDPRAGISLGKGLHMDPLIVNVL